MSKPTLELSNDELHDLHVALAKSRAKFVRVNHDALRKLLSDHAKAIAAAGIAA